MTLIVLPVMVFMAFGCGGDGTIASGGDFVLSVEELRYEITKLGPSSRYSDTPDGRRAVVEKLATRSYLAAEAEERGYGGDDLTQAVKVAEDQAVAEAYRMWKVDTSVRAPRLKRKPWIEYLDRRLYLKELVFAVYPVAVEALADLRAGRRFEDLLADIEGREDVRFNDPGLKIWKDFSREVANVVFQAGKGEATDIIPGPDGYHIFYVADDEKFGMGLELLSLRSRKFVTAMEEKRLLDAAKRDLVRKYDVDFREEGMAAAMRAFATAFGGERPDDSVMGEVVAGYSGGQVVVGDLFNMFFTLALESRPYVGDFHGVREATIELLLPVLETKAGYDMGLGRLPEVAWAGKMAREDYLVPSMEDYFRSQIEVTDQDIVDYYAERRQDMVTPMRYKARRILVSSQQEMMNVMRRLEAGRDFGQVAMQLSQDRQTAPHGGDIGWVSAGMIAAYDSVAATLSPGEISRPFTTHSGIEILLIEEKEAPRELTFEEAVPQMRTYITNTRANELLKDWVTSKKSEVNFTINEQLLDSIWLPPPEFVSHRAGPSEGEETEKVFQPLPKID
jgi:parvulin-like peptidyl-prolyl isomerase